MNVHPAPIGLFDSGFGGLSVALEIRRLLPGERLLYVADSLFCPYGSRSPDEIRWRTLLAVDALIERGIKLLIVACNTATAVVLEELRVRFSIPIIGLEPAVKPAIAASRNGRIAVLATPRTAASERLHRLIQQYGQGVDVRAVAAPGLVDLVEAGSIDDDRAVEAVKPLIEPLIREGVDTLVLGCTHYPFLRGAIQAVAGSGVTLVDSGAAIARRARALLDQHGANADTMVPGGVELLTTGDVAQVSAIASRLLQEPVSAAWLPLPTAPIQTRDYDPAAVAPPKLSAAWTCSVSAGAYSTGSNVG
jgi:glutamate racemase